MFCNVSYSLSNPSGCKVSMAKGFAVVGGLFAASECVVEKVFSSALQEAIELRTDTSISIAADRICGILQ